MGKKDCFKLRTHKGEIWIIPTNVKQNNRLRSNISRLKHEYYNTQPDSDNRKENTKPRKRKRCDDDTADKEKKKQPSTLRELLTAKGKTSEEIRKDKDILHDVLSIEFKNQKHYGFLTPTEGDTITTEFPTDCVDPSVKVGKTAIEDVNELGENTNCDLDPNPLGNEQRSCNVQSQNDDILNSKCNSVRQPQYKGEFHTEAFAISGYCDQINETPNIETTGNLANATDLTGTQAYDLPLQSSSMDILQEAITLSEIGNCPSVTEYAVHPKILGNEDDDSNLEIQSISTNRVIEFDTVTNTACYLESEKQYILLPPDSGDNSSQASTPLSKFLSNFPSVCREEEVTTSPSLFDLSGIDFSDVQNNVSPTEWLSETQNSSIKSNPKNLGSHSKIQHNGNPSNMSGECDKSSNWIKCSKTLTQSRSSESGEVKIQNTNIIRQLKFSQQEKIEHSKEYEKRTMKFQKNISDTTHPQGNIPVAQSASYKHLHIEHSYIRRLSCTRQDTTSIEVVQSFDQKNESITFDVINLSESEYE